MINNFGKTVDYGALGIQKEYIYLDAKNIKS